MFESALVAGLVASGADAYMLHVIPKSWAPYAAMEKRTNLYAAGDDAGIDALEKELLAENATHKDWCCTADLMAKTAHGMDTIYMQPRRARKKHR